MSDLTPGGVVGRNYAGKEMEGRTIKHVHLHPDTKVREGHGHNVELDWRGRLGIILEFTDGAWTFLRSERGSIGVGEDTSVVAATAYDFEHGYRGELGWAFSLGLIPRELYESTVAAEKARWAVEEEASDRKRYEQLRERFGDRPDPLNRR